VNAASDAAISPRMTLRSRHWLLFILCVTEYVPISLVYTTLPVVLRRAGGSLEDIGILSMAFLPWALKFLWAPLVDRWGSPRLGRYRSWLFALVPLAAAMMAGLGFLDLPALLMQRRALGISVLVLLTIVCSTIDTAAHGIAVVALSPEERGYANGVQIAGQMVGNLLGGGVAVASIAVWGWRGACFTLAGLYVLPFVAVLSAREPPFDPSHAALRLGDFVAVVRRPRMTRWLLWLVLFGLAYGLFGVPYQAALVDAGLELTEIGLVQGVVMSVAGLAGGLVAGFLMKRTSRRGAFFACASMFAVLLAPSVLTFTVFERARWALYGGLASAYFGVVAASTVLYAMMMDRSRNNTASSDFTLQYCVLQVVGFVSWGMGASLAERVGSGPTLAAALFLALSALALAAIVFRPSDFASTEQRDNP
jgi:MFS family permease